MCNVIIIYEILSWVPIHNFCCYQGTWTGMMSSIWPQVPGYGCNHNL